MQKTNVFKVSLQNTWEFKKKKDFELQEIYFFRIHLCEPPFFRELYNYVYICYWL